MCLASVFKCNKLCFTVSYLCTSLFSLFRFHVLYTICHQQAIEHFREMLDGAESSSVPSSVLSGRDVMSIQSIHNTEAMEPCPQTESLRTRVLIAGTWLLLTASSSSTNAI